MSDMVLLYEFRNILLTLESEQQQYLNSIVKLREKLDALIKQKEVNKNG